MARFVELAVLDPAMRGEAVEVGGPENLGMKQFAQTFETVSGKAGKVSHVPLPMMRLMAVLTRPVNPTLVSKIHAGVVPPFVLGNLFLCRAANTGPPLGRTPPRPLPARGSGPRLSGPHRTPAPARWGSCGIWRRDRRSSHQT